MGDFIAGANVLVTGSSGFIGSRLARTIAEHIGTGSLHLLDRRPPVEVGCNSVAYHTADITDGSDWLPHDVKFDYIFHQAALVDTTVADETLMTRTNVAPFKTIIARAMADEAVLVYASSASVYGHAPAPQCVGRNESPANVYAASKLAMDTIARECLASSPGIPIAGLRYFNVYGPGEEHKGTMMSMIGQLCNKARAANAVTLFTEGEQSRDFVHVDDVVSANIAAARERISGVFNVGTGVGTTFNDVVGMIEKRSGPVKTTYIPNPHAFYQDHTEAALDPSFGYVPKITIDQGIADYYDSLEAADAKAQSEMYEVTACGALHQVGEREPFQYDAAYVTDYNKYGEAGRQLASTRIGYLIGVLGRIPDTLLDVGYGNGDCLRAAMAHGVTCRGTDIAGVPPPEGSTFLTLEAALATHHDVVCFFDSLEHFEDIDFVADLDCDYVYISLPWCQTQRPGWFMSWKHRKPGEHLWHFSDTALVAFFDSMGYDVVQCGVGLEDAIRQDPRCSPNILTGVFQKRAAQDVGEAKLTAYRDTYKSAKFTNIDAGSRFGKRPITVRTAPGMGDIFWVYQQLAPWYDEINLHVLVTEPDPVQCRSKAFIEALREDGKVNSWAYETVTGPELQEAILVRPNPTVPQPTGHDSPWEWTDDRHYTLMTRATRKMPIITYSANAPLEAGLRLERFGSVQRHVKLPTHKNPVSHSKYLVLYISGSTRHVSANTTWPPRTYIGVIQRTFAFYKESMPIVVIGAAFDGEVARHTVSLARSAGLEAELHLTPLRETFAILRDASYMVGFQSGLSVIADHYDVPQCMLYFDRLAAMMTSWPKPQSLESGTHFASVFSAPMRFLPNFGKRR